MQKQQQKYLSYVRVYTEEITNYAAALFSAALV